MPAKRSTARSTLERKIHFYRADIGVDSGGRPLTFDPAPALTVIGRLPFADGTAGRYLVGNDGNAVCVWPEISRTPQTLRFCQNPTYRIAAT
jgi:hypothetical protein